MVEDEGREVDTSAASPGGDSAALGGQTTLAAILARGVLRVLAKRGTALAATTCLSPASKPCLDAVNTERSR